MRIDEKKKKAFQERILNHYTKHKRDFPWRKTKDPYKILVSEVMLQQTQTERVVPKYAAFLKKYPTTKDLSRANERELLLAWSGLGYNKRAIYLKRACKRVIDTFDGKFPKDEERLRSLPGVGPYTSRAVLAFAFNRMVPVIDTNIRRILIYEFRLDERVSFRQLEEIAKEVIPEKKSRIWHNALMDYGAMFATARKTGIASLGKQGKFEGSRRWYRSRILKLALKKRMQVNQVSKELKKPVGFINDLCSDLSKEGLIKFKDDRIWI